MILVTLLGTLALPVVAGAVYQAIGTWRDRRRFPPPGRLVRFNERRMHIHVTGAGTPTVVFESGMGASCLSWTLVQPQVAQFARAVSYDRAGHGWSDPTRRPRTARQIAQELHTLLDATGVPGPYVLVGHSFGGYVNRAFAQTPGIATERQPSRYDRRRSLRFRQRVRQDRDQEQGVRNAATECLGPTAGGVEKETCLASTLLYTALDHFR